VKSLRYTLIAVAIVGVFGGLLAWAAQAVIARGEPGDALTLASRLVLYFANQQLVYGPFVLPVVFGLAALAGAWRSRPSTIAEERRQLMGWLVFEILAWAAGVALHELVRGRMPLSIGLGGPQAPLGWHLLVLQWSLGPVTFVATAVLAVHLQSRVQRPGAWLKVGHVAVAMIVAWFFGPAVVLPPALVLWNSRGA
jgi:hypothetical protein